MSSQVTKFCIHSFHLRYFLDFEYQIQHSKDLSGISWLDYLPKRSHDLDRKKWPLMKTSWFLKTCSTLAGSLITIAGGSEGTDTSYVPNPVCRSHWLNHSRSLCLGWRNQNPLPTTGRVPGGRLFAVNRVSHHIGPFFRNRSRTVIFPHDVVCLIVGLAENIAQ